ncbi:MAG: hypothetical protein CNLJKLNK_00437 [Holosporales bacterium]
MAHTLEEGKTYYWCTCGLSKNDPFCDGAHKGTGQKSLPFQVQETCTQKLCGCKKTQNPPYCDGSHNTKD